MFDPIPTICNATHTLQQKLVWSKSSKAVINFLFSFLLNFYIRNFPVQTQSWVTSWRISPSLCCTRCCGWCPTKWQLSNYYNAKRPKVQCMEKHLKNTHSNQLRSDIQWNVILFVREIPCAKATIFSFPKSFVSWMTELKKQALKTLSSMRWDFTWGCGDQEVINTYL